MKFELTEPNKSISTKDLIDDLCRVAQILNKESVTKKDYDNHGNYSYRTYYKRFGSWKSALEEAGLKTNNQPWGGDISQSSIPENYIIEDLQRVAKKLDNSNFSLNEYNELGQYSTSAVSKRFGGWNNAKKAADLEFTTHRFSNEDYFENLQSLWEHLGRQPKYKEVVPPLSKFHVSSYERRFGSWRKSLERFINYVSKDGSEEEEKEAPPKKSIITSKKQSKSLQKPVVKKRTNRIANLRQRFRVMKRDGFKCVLCGSSPATQAGCELHIDHIIPWSKGGETVEENLRTLCSSCNLGRSNKE
jgi:hypothetical protein